MEWYNKIRAKRQQMGMSQRDLARAVGLTQAAIDKIESGNVRTSRATPKIAQVLGLPLSELDGELARAASHKGLAEDQRHYESLASPQARVIQAMSEMSVADQEEFAAIAEVLATARRETLAAEAQRMLPSLRKRFAAMRRLAEVGGETEQPGKKKKAS